VSASKTKPTPTVPATALVATGNEHLPAHLRNLEDVAGLGNSSDPNDSSLPFLSIIQTGSPQIKEEDAKFIPEAKAGWIFNTATRTAWAARVGKQEPGVLVIPCGYLKNFVEWKPNRGGYADTHPYDIEHIKKLGAKKTKAVVEGKEREQIMLPNGNLLTETAYTFLMVERMPMVLGASSTALGAMRDWMAYRRSQRLNGRELPSFAKTYRLQTVLQTRDANSWYNWKFSDNGYTEDAEEYELATMFARSVAKGEVAVGRPDYFIESPSSDGDDGIPV
jgi:hypothetical protein